LLFKIDNKLPTTSALSTLLLVCCTSFWRSYTIYWEKTTYVLCYKCPVSIILSVFL